MPEGIFAAENTPLPEMMLVSKIGYNVISKASGLALGCVGHQNQPWKSLQGQPVGVKFRAHSERDQLNGQESLWL